MKRSDVAQTPVLKEENCPRFDARLDTVYSDLGT